MRTDAPQTDTVECDLLVIGSGAGGMGAAIAGVSFGMRVVVLEKDARLGGTTSSRSGGWIWVPGNHQAKAAGVVDSREDALAYFRARAGERFDEARVTAFLDNGPDVVDFLMRETPVVWIPQPDFPDYYPGEVGARVGRSLFPVSMDARRFAPRVRELVRPLARAQRMLGMQVDGDEFDHFYLAGRRAKSARVVVSRLLKLVRDRAAYGESMHLTGGNVMIAGLVDAALRRGVDFRTSAPAQELLVEDGRVVGAVTTIEGRTVHVRARRGVVLATGGFAHDAVRRAQALPAGATYPEMWAAVTDTNSGDGIRLGESAGGVFDTSMPMPVALTPFSRLQRGEGVLEVLPYHAYRGVPGLIAVTPDGKRFGNEACNYHLFGANLLAATKGHPEPVGWFVADHRSVRRHGLGAAFPRPARIGALVRSGYLRRGRTLAELAAKTGIDRRGLEETVHRFNDDARRGIDTEFGRGKDSYDHAMGDPDHRPNPSLGPLEEGPFYAVRVFTGALSTFAGLKTDAEARVVDADGVAVPGLYAAGLDMTSIGGGDYIGGGINIGPALTFGYLGARHAATGLLATDPVETSGARIERRVSARRSEAVGRDA